jgi:hypothetical protein
MPKSAVSAGGDGDNTPALDSASEAIVAVAKKPGGRKEPPRNRLAKVLPEQWRKMLIEHGVPKRRAGKTQKCNDGFAGGV